MTISQIHPDDERLSALAGADPDAAGDATLRGHVSGCARCASTVDELARLRAALATLPDLAPPRPLRLVPPTAAQPSAVERLADVVRRTFAPVMAAGVAAALVGAVGTVGDAGLLGGAGMGAAPAATIGAGQPGAAQELQHDTSDSAAEGGGMDVFSAATPEPDAAAEGDAGRREAAADAEPVPPPAEPERSPWPMVAFAGVTVVVGALLLRWILLPRAP